MVDLRPALLDRNVQPVLGVDARCQCLIVTTVFRLGFPIQAEHDFIRRLGWDRRKQQQQGCEKPHRLEPDL